MLLINLKHSRKDAMLLKRTLSFISFFVVVSCSGVMDKSYFYENGISEHKNKKYESAIYFYDKALSINEDYLEAYIARGNAKAELRNFNGAIDDYNSALKINQNYAEAYFLRGVA